MFLILISTGSLTNFFQHHYVNKIYLEPKLFVVFSNLFIRQYVYIWHQILFILPVKIDAYLL
jgi:hypothetical protein